MAFYNALSDTSNFVTAFTPEPRDAFGVFAKGYVRAADRMAEILLQRHFSDYEAYPVVYLYRHALELSLKHIIYSCSTLAAYQYRDDIEDALHNTHDLSKLATTANAVLSALYPEDEFISALCPRIRVTCNEFDEIDADSFAYRYPTDRKGRASTKQHQTINLRAFATHLSALLEDLDTIHFGVSAEIDMAQDALTEAYKAAGWFNPH